MGITTTRPPDSVVTVEPRVAKPGAPTDSSAKERRSLTRHTAYYFIGRVATGLVGMLSLVAFTRVLSPADYGRYAVIVAIVGLIAAVGFQWLRQCLIRFRTGETGACQPLLGTLGALFTGLTVTMAVICAVLVVAANGGVLRVGLSATELGAVGCLAAAVAWFELSADAMRTEFKPWRYSAATFTRALLSLVLGVVAALVIGEVWMVVIAMAAAYLLASAMILPRWLIGLGRIDAATWSEVKRLAAYGLPLAATLGMTFVLSTADRLMLAGMRSYVVAGIYSSAYDLAQFSIGTLLVGLGLGSLPLAVGALKKGDGSVAALLGRNLVLGAGIGAPAVVGLVILAPGLDRLLLGNYTPGHSEIVTMIVAVGVGLAAVRSYCVDVVFMLQQRTWLQALVIGVSALFNVLLNLAFIPRWGAAGAATATLAAFVVAFVGSWILSRRYVEIPVAIKEFAKITVGCVAMALVLAAVSPNEGQWPRLLGGVAGGAVTYALVVLGLDVAGSRGRLVALLANRTSGG